MAPPRSPERRVLDDLMEDGRWRTLLRVLDDCAAAVSDERARQFALAQRERQRAFTGAAPTDPEPPVDLASARKQVAGHMIRNTVVAGAYIRDGNKIRKVTRR